MFPFFIENALVFINPLVDLVQPVSHKFVKFQPHLPVSKLSNFVHPVTGIRFLMYSISFSNIYFVMQ